MSDLRIRSTSEVLDATFAIYRKHFGIFFTIATLAFIPAIIGQFITMQALANGVSSEDVPLLPGLFFTIGWIATIIINGAIVSSTSNAYLGQPIDIGAALKVAFSRKARLIGAEILRWFITFLGILLFIIPGLFLLYRLYLAQEVIMLEDSSITGSLRRSSALVKGHFWKSLAVFVLLILLYAVVFGVLGMVAAIFLGSTWLTAAGGVIMQLVIVAILSPLFPIARTLLYYDFRIRHEGLDLDVLSTAIPATPTPAPQAG